MSANHAKTTSITADAYRTPARRCAGVAPVGLVRMRACQCAPPGRIWCAWHRVERGDEWRCAHGERWTRTEDLAAVFFTDGWMRRERGEPIVD